MQKKDGNNNIQKQFEKYAQQYTQKLSKNAKLKQKIEEDAFIQKIQKKLELNLRKEEDPTMNYVDQAATYLESISSIISIFFNMFLCIAFLYAIAMFQQGYIIKKIRQLTQFLVCKTAENSSIIIEKFVTFLTNEAGGIIKSLFKAVFSI